MKANSNTVLTVENTVLVPYKSEHVPIYHEWMKDPFLQEMTASEPLSIEEEYEMQKSWAVDEAKCTFIIVSPDFESNRVGRSATFGGMIGDVNLYWNDHDDPHSAEIEVMIAESSARSTGHGKRALLGMMSYATTELETTSFVAKISQSNDASIGLFTKLGFEVQSVSEVFKEVTMVATAEALAAVVGSIVVEVDAFEG
ncbi:GNAT domain-containing protein [Fimicolochytrium jonesii]|uniref:GNAT domain-containing protein n=1 Tax=Fimicolochytrium jonesii TaxID=1396493 RepID=UPI0022FF0E98|nr:GNAT domain-containing protein [Fimicolochytrium jonesii]KAI8823090.1 GNAT domain-containing protein [Fimicolochytrium jonesii]